MSEPFYIVEPHNAGKNVKISINALPEEAWTKLGQDEGVRGTDLWREVPWLRAGVDVIANAMADLPFTFSRNGEIVTDSTGYEDPTGGLLPNPRRTFSMAAAACAIYGRAYWAMPKNQFNFTPELRWLNPASLKPEFTERGELELFKRKLKDGRTVEFSPDEVLYCWLPDPDVENGPPMSSRVSAALMAAKAYHAKDEFVRAFFERGALKATILTLEGHPMRDEVEKIKTWWGRFFRGVQSAWRSAVFNADNVKPVVIGEGLESLENNALTASLREDIATALGVPHSILFSNASNFAVAEQDFRNLYQLTIAPLSSVIADAMNDQLFADMDLALEFHPEQMDIFQEDEEDRTGALINVIQALEAGDPEVVTFTMQMLGFELPAGWEYTEFEAMLGRVKQQKAENAALMRETMTPEPTELTPEPGTRAEEDKSVDFAALDLDKWQRKSAKSLAKGNGASVPFDSEHIDDLTHAAISGALESAESEADIAAAFMFYLT